MAEEKRTLSTVLDTKLTEVQEGLPSDFNKTRFIQNCIALLNGNEALAKFAKQYGTAQISQGFCRSAFLGLDFMQNHAYLIPYGSTLDYQISYKGHQFLAKKYSTRPIKNIYAKIIRDGDAFEEEIIGGEQTITFKPKPLNEAKIVGAFAVIQYVDGGMIYDVMTVSELENTRKQSKASNSPAWTKFTGEMYKKVVLKRLLKNVDLDLGAKQAEYMNEDLALRPQPTDEEIVDVEAPVVEEEVVDAETGEIIEAE